MGKVIGFNGANNTYQVMIDGTSEYYKANMLKKSSPKKHKTNKKKLKRTKKIKQKKFIQINNQNSSI